MEKSALSFATVTSPIKKVLNSFEVAPSKFFAGATLAAAGNAMYKAYEKIKNDTVRKNLINDLHLNDPVLKNVPEEQLLEWYATIYHFAPKYSLDKTAVREVLQNFARFGRVDANTLKMLAETEKAMNSSDSSSFGALLGNIANVAFGG